MHALITVLLTFLSFLFACSFHSNGSIFCCYLLYFNDALTLIHPIVFKLCNLWVCSPLCRCPQSTQPAQIGKWMASKFHLSVFSSVSKLEDDALGSLQACVCCFLIIFYYYYFFSCNLLFPPVPILQVLLEVQVHAISPSHFKVWSVPFKPVIFPRILHAHVFFFKLKDDALGSLFSNHIFFSMVL